MKRTLIGPILAVLALVLIGAMFVYFYLSLNRLDSKVLAARDTIVKDSGQITAIVNFFNANANAQTNKTQ
jgi:hypothetical protein